MTLFKTTIHNLPCQPRLFGKDGLRPSAQNNLMTVCVCGDHVTHPIHNEQTISYASDLGMT